MKNFLIKNMLILCMVLLVSAAYAERNPAESLNRKIEEASKTVQIITPKHLMDWIVKKKEFVLIDVREKSEVEAGKIEYSSYMHVPRGMLDIIAAKGALKTDQAIVIYCKKGSRGLMAAKALQELGFANVQNLEGGIHGWMEAGLPITNSLGTFKAVPYDLTGCAENE